MKSLPRWSGGLIGGQPLPSTHPHILPASSTVLPGGITRQELLSRRLRLGELVGPESIAIVPSYRRQFSSQNIFYRFKQSNNVLYLTGLVETDSLIVIRDSGNGLDLFRKSGDEHDLLWEGPKCDEESLKSHFGFNNVYQLEKLGDYLERYKHLKIFSVVSENNDCINLKNIIPGKSYDLTSHLHTLRKTKSKKEVEILRRAAEIAANSFKITMSGQHSNENDIENEMEYLMRRGGASGLSYVPVIAGSARSCIIHYTRNDQQLVRGDLVLVDAGAMCDNYCSDITRTWPVYSGSHNEAQRDIYEAVFNVQDKVLKALNEHPLQLSLSDCHTVAYYETINQLDRLGFPNPQRQVNNLFPHSIGHFIGMDLHDCPTVDFEETLQENMVITIEPGLYIPNSTEYPEKYRGIGVRIEDDILILRNGVEILSKDAPKLPSEIFK